MVHRLPRVVVGRLILKGSLMGSPRRGRMLLTSNVLKRSNTRTCPMIMEWWWDLIQDSGVCKFWISRRLVNRDIQRRTTNNAPRSTTADEAAATARYYRASSSLSPSSLQINFRFTFGWIYSYGLVSAYVSITPPSFSTSTPCCAAVPTSLSSRVVFSLVCHFVSRADITQHRLSRSGSSCLKC